MDLDIQHSVEAGASGEPVHSWWIAAYPSHQNRFPVYRLCGPFASQEGAVMALAGEVDLLAAESPELDVVRSGLIAAPGVLLTGRARRAT